MTTRTHFRPTLFAFLEDLRAHNERGWFEENRERYLHDVREPLQAFVADFASPLAKISRHFVADPRPQGGSIFRIHRDVRFSRDKSPYKTHAAAQFRHVLGKDVHAPGFYLHLEPGRVFVGAGIWRPDSATLASIREAIVDDPKAWKRAIGAKRFRDLYELGGDSLKRMPRGFDQEHPLAEDLKRKDYVASRDYPDKKALEPDFPDEFTKACKDLRPLVRFLCEALELPF